MRKWNCEDIQNRRKGKWGKTESKTLMDALYAEAKAAGMCDQKYPHLPQPTAAVSHVDATVSSHFA